MNFSSALGPAPPPSPGYDQDFLLWLEDTAAKLKARDFEHLDLEALIEEVGSLGRSQRRELSSRLTRLLEHLLKRLYVTSPQDDRGWEQTIRHQRLELRLLLEDSPSLKGLWVDRLGKAWTEALALVRQDYPDTPFPDEWPFEADLEAMLDRPFWQTPP